MPDLETAQALTHCLATIVVANVAAIQPSRVLCGQPLAERESTRPPVAVDFYAERRLTTGLLGHRHLWPELATVLTGHLLFGIGERIYEAQAGDWLVCDSGVPHGECSIDQAGAYELLWLGATVPGVRLHRSRFAPGEGYRVVHTTLLSEPPRGVTDDLRTVCRAPWPTQQPPLPALLRVLAWCLDRLQAVQRPEPQPYHPAVQAVREHLAAALDQPPTVAELARTVGLSPNYLSSLFAQQCGQSIRQFVEARRMEQACGYLRQTRRSVGEIAAALGFADTHHFSHAFRRAMHLSPTEYRGRQAEIQTPDR